MNNLLKKVLTVVLSTAMLLSTLTFGGAGVVLAEGYVEKPIVATEDYTGKTEADGVYFVASEADWTALAGKGTDFAGKTVVLTSDVTFAAANVTLSTFAGKLDGNGHTLKGVTQPLINTLNGGATIQNLIIDEANINAPTVEMLGAIANVVNVTADITFSNVAVQNSTVSNVTSTIDADKTCAGGMIGRVNSGTATLTLTNCTVSGSVAGKQYTAGLISVASINTCTVKFENCKNSANLTVQDKPAYNIYIGGFLGYAKLKDVLINNCENSGNITVDSSIATNQYLYVGGFLGRDRGPFTMTNCLNTGNVTVKLAQSGAAFIGGLVGNHDTGVANISSCVNYGNVSTAADTVSADYLGGILGWCAKDTNITGCINYGNVTSPTATKSYTSNKETIGGSAAGIVCAVISGVKLSVSGTYNMGTISSADALASGIVAQTSGPLTLTGCVNVGEIYSCFNPENKQFLQAPGTDRHAAAGIWTAPTHLNANGSTVTNCTNVGRVVAPTNVGGVFGYNTVADLPTIAITGCSNSGALTSAGKTGGIVAGSATAVSVSNCVATGAYTGATNGAIAAATANVTVADCKASVTLNDVYTAWEGAAVSTKTAAEMLSELAVLNLEAQTSKVADGKFDIVMLAGMNSQPSRFTKVGFEVVRIVDGTVATLTAEGTSVYDTLKGYDENGETKTVNATGYADVTLLSALKITNVSTSENVTYLYRSFAVQTADEVDTTLYGTWSAVSFDAVAAA